MSPPPPPPSFRGECLRLSVTQQLHNDSTLQPPTIFKQSLTQQIIRFIETKFILHFTKYYGSEKLFISTGFSQWSNEKTENTRLRKQKISSRSPMSTKIHSYRWFCGQHRKIKFFTTSQTWLLLNLQRSHAFCRRTQHLHWENILVQMTLRF